MNPEDKNLEMQEPNTPNLPGEPVVVPVEPETIIVRHDAADETSETVEAVETVEIVQTSVGPATVRTTRRVSSGMLGGPEIAILALSSFALLMVIVFYFFVLTPADADLKAKKAQRDDLELKFKTSEDKFKNFSTTKDFVASLTQSVDDFEVRHLPFSSIGRTGLYDRINGLMATYNLRNTSGPDFSPLDIRELKPGQQEKEEKGKSKLQSLFPGVYINVTVEGTYQNMRRFIREIEAGQQFVVISAVELEAAENNGQATKVGQPPQGAPQGGGAIDPRSGLPLPGGGQFGGQPAQPARPAAPKGKTSGENVSLHLEMAAYFRREPAVPTNTAAPAQ